MLVAAVPASASFPYTRAGGDPTDPNDLFLNAGTVPNDLGGNEFKFAATPDPANVVNNALPVELGGVRGAHVVDDDGTAATAFQTTTGRPDVTIAILDSGIKWNDASAMNDLRKKTRLNEGELPKPRNNGLGTPNEPGENCGGGGPYIHTGDYDLNGDGVFNIIDYSCDNRVQRDTPKGVGPAGVKAGLTDAGQALPGLVGADWLAARLDRPGLRVVDVRPQPAYNGGHIPGAVRLDPESLRGAVDGLPSMLLPGELLAAHFSLLGLSPLDLVVIAAGDRPIDATLFAMACERLGHVRYAILDGGVPAWQAAGRPLTTVLPDVTRSRYPAPPPGDGFTVDAAAVLAAIRSAAPPVVLDVRPADYYAGTKSDEARAGHIPGAINHPFTEDQVKSGDVVRFKPVEELARSYAGLIPDQETPVIVHCRTGHQASLPFFVLTRLLGYKNVRFYDAGWTEWAAKPTLPMETDGSAAK